MGIRKLAISGGGELSFRKEKPKPQVIERDLSGIVCALPPVCSFPGGALTYTYYAAKVLSAPIYAPAGEVAVEYLPDDSISIVDKIDEIEGLRSVDYSLVTIPSDGRFDHFDLMFLPGKIIFVVHDGDHFHRYGGEVWSGFADGFVTVLSPTEEYIRKYNKDAPILRLPLPYIARTSGVDLDIDSKGNKRENIVVSLGRIVPERGHRLVATLSGRYKIYIIGQKVDEPYEYGLYYDKVSKMGVQMWANVLDEDKRDLLSEAKVFLSFPFSYEIEENVEYNHLECMEMGLVPIVANWAKDCFEEVGLRAFYVECPADAVKYIDMVFSDDVLRREIVEHNFGILKHWEHMFADRFRGFVEGLLGQ